MASKSPLKFWWNHPYVVVPRWTPAWAQYAIWVAGRSLWLRLHK